MSLYHWPLGRLICKCAIFFFYGRLQICTINVIGQNMIMNSKQSSFTLHYLFYWNEKKNAFGILKAGYSVSSGWTLYLQQTSISSRLVGNRARKDPQHPPACCKRRMKWCVPSDKTGKIDAPWQSRCGRIKTPTLPKTLSVEHKSKFCCPSPTILMSPYE
jgi:hypothetical protein